MAESQNGVTIDAITALIAASKRMQFSHPEYWRVQAATP